jgi:hypothetical protein
MNLFKPHSEIIENQVLEENGAATDVVHGRHVPDFGVMTLSTKCCPPILYLL